jgi:hypothetical protein
MLLNKIINHAVFQNNSDNQQLLVEQQLAVTLYQFGHYGNAASQQKVGLWAGWGAGTVDLCTRQVMTAICDEAFRKTVMEWPDEDRKSKAKQWVEDHSCPAWQDGWCIVDGTLVPLFAHPVFYRNSWFDQKSNYSLNVQVRFQIPFNNLNALELYYCSKLISTPNLQIIDYGVGLPGSQHDATAWKETWIPKEHESLLEAGEWVWGDTAYPLQTWCQAPYKKSVFLNYLYMKFLLIS